MFLFDGFSNFDVLKSEIRLASHAFGFVNYAFPLGGVWYLSSFHGRFFVRISRDDIFAFSASKRCVVICVARVRVKVVGDLKKLKFNDKLS